MTHDIKTPLEAFQFAIQLMLTAPDAELAIECAKLAALIGFEAGLTKEEAHAVIALAKATHLPDA